MQTRLITVRPFPELPSRQTHPESSPSSRNHVNEHEIYSQGKPADLMKYDWYHGNITREQADLAMKLSGNNNPFLIRNSGHKLILSKEIDGWTSHDYNSSQSRGLSLGREGRSVQECS